MFEGLSGLANLMKNAQQLQSRAQEMKARLSQLRVEGTAGGGMVKVEVTGEQTISAVHIESHLLEGGDRELLEDLLAAAVNQGLQHAREAAALEMSSLADGLGIAGLGEALSRFGVK